MYIYTVIQAVHSLLYIVTKCNFFRVVTWKGIINIYTNMRRVLTSVIYYIYIYMKSSFPKRDKRQKKIKMSSSCHFAVYWTYSLLHQCFMPNRYIFLFKMYLTLLTSQRGALATDAKSCSLWHSLLERLPPAPETRVRDPLGVMVWTRGGLTIIV